MTLENIMDFMVAVEALKGVNRKTKPVGLDRFENSAEHSWHVTLMALILKGYADPDIDIMKVMTMLLIHDLGEIHVGDTIIYESETEEMKAKEGQGVKDLLSYLGGDVAGELMDLWLEFEAGQTKEAAYAKAIDRIPPLLHNLRGDYCSWKDHGISLDKALGVNQRIEKASPDLWRHIKGLLEDGQARGLFAGGNHEKRS